MPKFDGVPTASARSPGQRPPLPLLQRRYRLELLLRQTIACQEFLWQSQSPEWRISMVRFNLIDHGWLLRLGRNIIQFIGGYCFGRLWRSRRALGNNFHSRFHDYRLFQGGLLDRYVGQMIEWIISSPWFFGRLFRVHQRSKANRSPEGGFLSRGKNNSQSAVTG